MPTLALSMIVKNEETFLRGCLQSVYGIVDEIVLVDTGSTDATIEIAKEFGAKIFSFPWVNDFSAARNESLSHVTSDWVLYLDADERLKAGQQKEIRKLLSQPAVYAYHVWIEGKADLREGAVAQRNAYPRIFRAHPSVRFEGRVHEQITPSLERMGWSVQPSDLVVEHLGYEQGFNILRTKAQRNRDILQNELEDKPENSYARFQYGNTLSILGEYDAAFRELLIVISDKTIASGIRASAFNLLAEIKIRKNENQEAATYAQQSIDAAQHQQLARWLAIAANINMGNYKQALSILDELYQRQSQKSNRSVPSYDVSIERWKIFYQQGVCFNGLQESIKAVNSFLQGLLENPDFNVLLPNLEEALHRCEPVQEWIVVLKRASQKYPDQIGIGLLLAEQYWRMQKQHEALELIHSLQRNPKSDNRTYAKELQWMVSVNDQDCIKGILTSAQQNKCLSYQLFKIAIDGALHENNFLATLSYLEWMIQAVPEQIPEQVFSKMQLLMVKLQQLSSSQK